jgi:hypothetical protein
VTSGSERPTFICLGAQKAGTQWLYDQARSHPQIWMPPIKEVRFFLDVFSDVQEDARTRLERAHTRRHNKIAVDDRSIEFLQRVVEVKKRPDDLAIPDYVGLFEPAGSLVTGDVSPGYHRLTEEQLGSIASGLPHSKFIYLLRDPIDRLWSQANMRVRKSRASPSVLVDASEFAKEIRLPNFRSLAFQSEAVVRLSRLLDDDRFRMFVMDDLRDNPIEYRRAVFAFIGLNADDCSLAADYNRKDGNAKLPMSPEHRAVLEDYFSDEYPRLEPYVAKSRIATRAAMHAGAKAPPFLAPATP